jgi:hypothetical protein
MQEILQNILHGADLSFRSTSDLIVHLRLSLPSWNNAIAVES